MGTQQIIILALVVVAFGGMGIGLSRSIKKHDSRMKGQKKKKGRNRYMPQAKNPGR